MGRLAMRSERFLGNKDVTCAREIVFRRRNNVIPRTMLATNKKYFIVASVRVFRSSFFFFFVVLVNKLCLARRSTHTWTVGQHSQTPFREHAFYSCVCVCTINSGFVRSVFKLLKLYSMKKFRINGDSKRTFVPVE